MMCDCTDSYYCPTSGDEECPRHSGFDVCCAYPEKHIPRDGTAPLTADPMFPKFSSEKLDFSQFHPLMHSIFSRECATYYGGRRQHLKLDWEYRNGDKFRNTVKRPYCWFGSHDWRVWYKRDDEDGTFVVCERCGTKPTPDVAAAEIDKADARMKEWHAKYQRDDLRHDADGDDNSDRAHLPDPD